MHQSHQTLSAKKFSDFEMCFARPPEQDFPCNATISSSLLFSIEPRISERDLIFQFRRTTY